MTGVTPNAVRFTKAQRMAQSMVGDVDRAIALRALYERCVLRHDIPKRFNNSLEAWGFEIVRTALVADLIMTLGRIHDVHDKSASIPALINLTADLGVVAAMKANARRWVLERPVHFTGSPEAAEYFESIRQHMKETQADEEANKMEKRAMLALRRARRFEKDEMRASLQRFRNKYLAHNSLNKGKPGLRNGDLSKLLDQTMRVVEDLTLALTGNYYNFKDSRDAWRTKANDFWKSAATGVHERKRARKRKIDAVMRSALN